MSWNGQEYSLYYSVVDTCCQMLLIAMVISQNKMWNTVLYMGSPGSFLGWLKLGESDLPVLE